MDHSKMKNRIYRQAVNAVEILDDERDELEVTLAELAP